MLRSEYAALTNFLHGLDHRVRFERCSPEREPGTIFTFLTPGQPSPVPPRRCNKYTARRKFMHFRGQRPAGSGRPPRPKGPSSSSIARRIPSGIFVVASRS